MAFGPAPAVGTNFRKISSALGPSHESGIGSAAERADEVGVKEGVEDRDKNTEIAEVGVEGDEVKVEEEMGFPRTAGRAVVIALLVEPSISGFDQGSWRVQGSAAAA